MSEAAMYSMNDLMSISDISVTALFRSLPSRASFYEFMDNILLLSDQVTNGYTSAVTSSENAERYCHKLTLLEKQLLKINASKAVWAVEQLNAAFDSGTTNRYKHFQDVSRILYQLTSKIRRAKISSVVERQTDTEEQKKTDPTPVQITGRLQAQAVPEMFEKAVMLINNFEFSHADKQLTRLEAFTFTEDIDRKVQEAHTYLASFNYNEASSRLREIISSLETEALGDNAASQKKILAVDDMPLVLSSVMSILSADYSVFCVTNCVSALQYLSDNHADLILLDIEMPDVDGYTLLGIIRKMDRYKDTPVIFLTSHASPDYVKKALELGGNDYMRKPVDAPTLLQKVEKHIK